MLITLLHISGAPTSQASGVYNYLISLDNALSATATDPAAPASAEFSIEGTIEVTTSVSQTTCSQASITLIDGNPSPSITLGEPIGTIVWELSTDCPPDANGVSLNSSASGLPQELHIVFQVRTIEFLFKAPQHLLAHTHIISFIIMISNYLILVW